MPLRIIYLSWPAREITGGIKLAFQHVEVLRANGYHAAVVTADGKPPAWFETTAPVGDPLMVTPEDVLVFPENHHALFEGFATRPNRKIVFCQNHYLACRGLAGQADYAEYGVSAIMAEGRHAAEFCRRRFPALPVSLVPVVLDLKTFCFEASKQLQIAFSPRKRPLEATCIRDLFASAGPPFSSIPWVEITGKSEREVAAILRRSAIYLSLARFESVGLSTLEAMACGCVVAGFTGQGAREYTHENNGFWAAEDDCVACTDQLIRATRMVIAGGPPHSDMLEAAHLTAQYYSRERLRRRLVEFWQRFLAGEGAAKGPAS